MVWDRAEVPLMDLSIDVTGVRSKSHKGGVSINDNDDVIEKWGQRLRGR